MRYGGQEQPTRVVTAPPPLRLLRRGQIDSVIYARKSAVNRTRAALRCKLTHVWLSCNTAPAAAVIGRHIVRIYNICTANCHMHAIKYRVVYTYISAAQIALEWPRISHCRRRLTRRQPKSIARTTHHRFTRERGWSNIGPLLRTATGTTRDVAAEIYTAISSVQRNCMRQPPLRIT